MVMILKLLTVVLGVAGEANELLCGRSLDKPGTLEEVR